MAELEKSVRSIEKPGLVGGASKLVPIGYGIKKLQITLVVGEWSRIYICSPNFSDTLCAEDELVSLDELQEQVAEFEDYVQSSDIAAMQSAYYRLISCTPLGLQISFHRAVIFPRSRWVFG